MLKACKVGPSLSTGNDASVTQSTDGGWASIMQTGELNDANVTQAVASNATATITQIGTGNFANVSQ